MTSKLVRLAMIATGIALVVGSVTACGDDSTASAPITSNPVTTTSMYQASGSSSAAPAPESQNGVDNPQAAPPASNSLPATEPDKSTPVPSSFPGPNGQPLSDKARRYLAELKRQDITFMGDTDNSVALTMAEYVCGARSKGTDNTMIKAFVTGSVGPGTKTPEEANAKADKVIKAASDHYC